MSRPAEPRMSRDIVGNHAKASRVGVRDWSEDRWFWVTHSEVVDDTLIVYVQQITDHVWEAEKEKRLYEKLKEKFG